MPITSRIAKASVLPDPASAHLLNVPVFQIPMSTSNQNLFATLRAGFPADLDSIAVETEMNMGMGWPAFCQCRQHQIKPTLSCDVISLNSGDLITQMRLALATLPEAAFLLPLWLVVGAALAIGSVVFAVAVARGGTRFPRAVALSNPLAVALAIAAASLPVPQVAAFAIPAAPNLAHVVVFGVALAALRR